MKLLLLGSTGLLGQAVAKEAAARGLEVTGAARSGADVALDIGDLGQLEAALDQHSPDLVFNCAALVDIDACEADPGAAYRVNARPLSLLANWSRSSGRPLVHVSTDHFFTGGGDRRHSERDPVVLVNDYARTKLAGEAFALTSPHALVLRTSIFGIRGWGRPSFAEWAIRSLQQREPITLFADAYTSSLDVAACARAALDLAAGGATGLLNLGSSEVYSKEAFVRALAAELGLSVDTATVGSAASMVPPRAVGLGLDVAQAEQRLGYALPAMQSVVAAVARQYRECA